MIIGVPTEILEHEARVAVIPETVREYVRMGFEVIVQSHAGEGALKSDQEYAEAGARIVPDALSVFNQADLLLKVKQPWYNAALGRHEAELIREGTMLITFLHPAAPDNHDMVRTLAQRRITALTMDGVPRTSRAQPMDALTSMSTITGYKGVLIAANLFPKFIPTIGTAIGTIKSAKVLVIGVGVVGLQAIATAKRLGGSVKAVDLRDDARKAADSLGAKVVGFEVPPDVAIDAEGYTKALSPDWLEKERAAIQPHVVEADIVILSALVSGEVAPVLVTEEMVRQMKPGSVIVDVSIDQGGNCAVTEPGHDSVQHQVHVCGQWNIPGSMPVHASWLYANNLLNYVQNLFRKGLDKPDLDDEIVRHTLVTHQGQILHAGALKSMKMKQAATV
jgi:H+-translocating NAD(P) transhydrogenase subunit alpha